MENIEIQPIEFKMIDYRDLKPLQGSLKTISDSNYSKLKKSFQDKGMFVPLFVWKSGDEYYLLDGHGREKLFTREEIKFTLDGNETYEVPCIIIKAEDERDAKEKILLISSQYQSFTKDGLLDFTSSLDPEWMNNTLNFDGINLKDFIIEFPEETTAEPKERDPYIRITFKNADHLNKAAEEIDEILKKYEGSYYSVSAGEI